MIRIENINKRFKKLHVLKNISADLNKGRVISLIGPNGSGKTTLIKCILGMVRPDSGCIFFDGKSVDKQVEYRSRIGYMPQIGRYPDNLQIGQLFDMVGNIRQTNKSIDESLIKELGLNKILNKPMRSLSGGTRQKVSAALAFYFHPEVLILDEPTAGLDPLATEILKDKILEEKNKGKLVLITSHILSDLQDLTSDVMYLQDGQIEFFCPLNYLQNLTGEYKLGKAIAFVMKHGFNKEEINHLKLA